ncbi:UNVERIFIED_CONTAM: hypothetical protein RMT77_008812 [Armadillidium vulgare]
MGMLVKLILLLILTVIKLTVSEKHRNNINNIKNSTVIQHQILETTTIPNYDYGSYDYVKDDYGDYNYSDYDFSNLPFELSNISAYDCVNKICVVKCCPEGQFFIGSPRENETTGCNNVSLFNVQDWKPKIMSHYTYVFGVSPKFTEQTLFSCSYYEADEFNLNADGTVYLYTNGKTLSQEFYCIDNMLEEGKIEENAMICDVQEDSSLYMTVVDYLHTTAVAISTIFLFIMVLVYIFTPHKLDLQKRCTFACCGTLFLGFFILLINRTPIVLAISENGCLTLAILGQYFLLSFYFWLNITCFEIFRIIRGTFNLQCISDLSQSIRRFFIYCLICHGFPLLISSVTLAMQMIPISSFPSSMQSHIIKPIIDNGRCWFEDGKSELVYYFVFEISLHILNAIYMGYTFYLLYKENLIMTSCRKETSRITVRTHAAINHLDEFKQQLGIYIFYIFIWIMNTASLIKRRAGFWRVIDIIVALQGVFVVIFILRTSKNILVNPLFEKISNAAREISSRIGEKRSFTSSSPETSEVFTNSSEKSNGVELKQKY